MPLICDFKRIDGNFSTYQWEPESSRYVTMEELVKLTGVIPSILQSRLYRGYWPYQLIDFQSRKGSNLRAPLSKEKPVKICAWHECDNPTKSSTTIYCCRRCAMLDKHKRWQNEGHPAARQKGKPKDPLMRTPKFDRSEQCQKFIDGRLYECVHYHRWLDEKTDYWCECKEGYTIG